MLRVETAMSGGKDFAQVERFLAGRSADADGALIERLRLVHRIDASVDVKTVTIEGGHDAGDHRDRSLGQEGAPAMHGAIEGRFVGR